MAVNRAGSHTLIQQTTDRAAINWQSFNIGANELVRFAQPSSSSIALNRVLGQNPTTILGSLSANGQIFLLNPNGVLFGQGAQVNVGALVASTLNLSNEDFMAGRYRFVREGSAGEVRNAGEIIANGGYVALIGPRVKNEGTITAANGSVALAAGDQVTLNLNGNKLIGLAVDQGALSALADNKGLLTADGGQVILTAKAADQLIKSVVNNDGIIEAGTLRNVNGVIRLEGDAITSGGTLRADGGAGGNGGSITLAAANDITLSSNSILSASGARGGDVTVRARGGTLLADGRVEAVGGGGAGGTVKLLGERVALVNAATVDASGKSGGGTVLVGGDFQGKNPGIQNAAFTFVSKNARINADAFDAGNGGKVIVWADDTTRFYGQISTRGGENGGDGGFVEVSGKDTLVFNGSADTRAPQGKTGMLLLDPANIIIANGSGDSTADGDALTTSFSGAPSGTTGTIVAGDNPVGGTLTLFESELEGIAATTNISLAATAAITINNLTDNNLNLAQNGGNSVSFNSATFAMSAGDTITTAGGAVNITTTGTAAIAGLNTGGGAITLNVGGTSTVGGLITGIGTSLTKQGVGTLTLSGANTYTGATTVNGGTLTLGASNVLADGTSVVVNGGTLATGTFSDTVAGVQLLSGSITGTTGILTSTSAYDLQSGTVSARLAGAVGLNKTTTGTVTLSGTGTNTYTGATTVQQGVLLLAKATALGTAAGATTVNAGAAVHIQGGIAVSESITLNGTGVANDGAMRNLSGSNTWSVGTVTLGAGGARINSDAGSTLILANAGAISGAGQPLTVGGAGNTTISKIISAGAVTKDGAGTLILAGANTYTGATTVNAGTLQLGANNVLPDTTNVVINSGATLGVNTRTDTVAGVQLISGSITGTTGILTSTSDYDLQSGTVGAILAGAVGLNKSAAGTVTLSRVNTYTGATTISAGTLELDATGTIAASSGVVNSGTFTIAANKTIDSMSGAGATTLGGTLTIGDASNTSSTYTGVMSGAGGLTKAGTGTLTLGGANTYAGTTTVSAGTLAITDASALGSTAAGTTVTAGATLNVNNVALAAEAITLNGTGVGSAGALTGTGAASLAGTVNLASPSTVGTTSAASSLTLNGAVSAPSVLTIAGAGDLTASNAGNDFSAVTVTNAGNVSLRDANDITLNASTMTGGLAIQASGTINVSGAISANGTGDAIVLSGGRFVNSAGAGALTTSAPGARWLVWSTNPNPFGGGTPDNRGGLAYSFKQYNAAFGDPVLGAGNGFLYALAPSITPGLTGTVTRVYDGSTTATLLAGNFTATGAVDGDTVTLSGTGAYDTRNAGTLKTVTATGITASAINGAATVYGYAVSPNTANGAIGEITAAPLMVTAQTDNRVYDGTTSSTAAPVVGALFAGDAVVTAPTQMYDNQNAGINKTLSASGLAINDGNGGNNYTITYVPNATGVITARGVTVTANNVAKIYGDADPAFTFNVGGLGLVGGDTVASVFGGALARAAGENVAGSPYAINQATLAAGDPNYNITTFTPGQFIIMPRPLTIAADNKSMRSGDLLPPFTATYAGFAFLDNSASLTGALAFTTPATIGSPAGAYVITPSGQTSNNYTISYVNGTLSVSAYGGVPADVLASINSGGSQLPPPTVSSLPAIPSALLAVQPANPVAESAATALALTVIDALPPPSAGGEVQEQARPSMRGNDQRRVLTGAVNRKVDIINEGVNLPSGVVR